MTARGESSPAVAPPHDSEAEQAVLGALLLDATAIRTVKDALKPPDFYELKHQRIYEGILTLSVKGSPADLITLSDELPSAGSWTSAEAPPTSRGSPPACRPVQTYGTMRTSFTISHESAQRTLSLGNAWIVDWRSQPSRRKPPHFGTGRAGHARSGSLAFPMSWSTRPLNTSSSLSSGRGRGEPHRLHGNWKERACLGHVDFDNERSAPLGEVRRSTAGRSPVLRRREPAVVPQGPPPENGFPRGRSVSPGSLPRLETGLRGRLRHHAGAGREVLSYPRGVRHVDSFPHRRRKLRFGNGYRVMGRVRALANMGPCVLVQIHQSKQGELRTRSRGSSDIVGAADLELALTVKDEEHGLLTLQSVKAAWPRFRPSPFGSKKSTAGGDRGGRRLDHRAEGHRDGDPRQAAGGLSPSAIHKEMIRLGDPVPPEQGSQPPCRPWLAVPPGTAQREALPPGWEPMSEPATDSILSLIHDELKRQIAATLDAGWKSDVLSLAEHEDREYNIVSAFRVEAAAAFQTLRQFPAKYRKIQGRPAEALPPGIARYRAESQESPGPRMTAEEHDAIVAERIEKDPVFARMMKKRTSQKEGKPDA